MAERSWKTSKWTKATLIPIGGNWGYAVGRLESGAIRIAKGKVSAADPESACPISQGNKINLKIKDRPQWEQIKAEVDALFDEAEDESGE